MIEEHFFSDRYSLFTALVEQCRTILAAAIQQRESASMLVSGGSTPQALYLQLSQESLDWQKISVALVDERWVNFSHWASNEAFIVKNLIRDNAATAKLISMKNSAKTAVQGQKACERRYQQQHRPFDLTILGMGSDGHTASLFPGAKGLSNALDLDNQQLCTAIMANHSEVTGDLTERMSLTLFGLLQSRQLHLLITGEEKLAVYRCALESNNVSMTPVSAILQQTKVPVHVYWAP